MTEAELMELRRHKWRLGGDWSQRPLRTLDDAREFVHNVGFCLMYPVKPPLLAPTFIGAYAGSDENLPLRKQAFANPRAIEAAELVRRLTRERSVFEASFGAAEGAMVISAAEFPYFYALIGERNPKQPPSAGKHGEKALTAHAFSAIQEHGPITAGKLLDLLGGALSQTAVERALQDLWSQLRIVRIDDAGVAASGGEASGEEAIWDVLYRWAPDVVKHAITISTAEALSALVGRYLETVIAAEQKDVEDFFSHFVPRSRVTELIKALLSAREFSHMQVDSKTLLRLTPRAVEEEQEDRKGKFEQPAIPDGRRERPWQKAKPAPRPAFDRPRRDYVAAAGEGQSRSMRIDRPKREFTERKSSARPPFAGKPAFGAKREGGRPPFDKSPFKKTPFQRPRPEAAGTEGIAAKRTGEGKSFDRPKREFARRTSSARPPFAGKPAFGAKREGSKPSYGEKRTYGEKRGGGKPTFSEKRGAGKSGFGTKPGAKFGAKPGTRQFGERPGTQKSSGARPSLGRPESGGRPASGKPSFRKTSSGKASFSKSTSGKPLFGRSRPAPTNARGQDAKRTGGGKSYTARGAKPGKSAKTKPGS